MFFIGLTGGIASGKSTVSKMFQASGFPVIDADLIARKVVEPGSSCMKRIRESFGEVVINTDGTLNREEMGKLIFADSNKRSVLNGITHPAIQSAMLWEAFFYFVRGEQCVVMDIPLLFESKKMLPLMSFIVVVDCAAEQQKLRLMNRNHYNEEEALQRIASQLPLAEKCANATHIIDNSGSLDSTQAQVKEMCLQLRKSKRHWPVRLLLGCFVTISLCGIRSML